MNTHISPPIAHVNPHKIVCLGASLASNKGAAAMLESLVFSLPQAAGPCIFTLLSTHPDADFPRAQQLQNVTVLDLRPWRLALMEIPAALFTAITRLSKVPSKFIPRTRVGQALHGADLSVDLAGISFVDGRGLANLMYNVLMTALPLLHGCATVKAAQAIGPCRKLTTKIAARLILPRLLWIGARGTQTGQHLGELHLHNFDEVADLAFSLPDHESLPDDVEILIAQIPKSPTGFILFMPSSVLKSMAQRNGIDYIQSNIALIRTLKETSGLPIIIAAHSYEKSSTENRMNDRPVMLQIAGELGEDITMIDHDLSAGQLRTIISKSSILVTSRFHSMISALSTQTPVLVVGWSHKYREVLHSFDLEECGVTHDSLRNPQELSRKIMDVLEHSQEIRGKIATFLPKVQESSHMNFEKISSLLKKK